MFGGGGRCSLIRTSFVARGELGPDRPGPVIAPTRYKDPAQRRENNSTEHFIKWYIQWYLILTHSNLLSVTIDK